LKTMMKARTMSVKRLLVVSAGFLFAFAVQAQEADSRLFAQWIENNEDGGQMLYDMSDGEHFVQACAYSEAYCEEMHGAFTPGVFYQLDKHDLIVAPDGKDSGTLKYRDMFGNVYDICDYYNLTKNKVNLLYEGEFDHELSRATRRIEVVNPNTEDLNVEDMSTVWNYWSDTSDVMARICKGKDLHQLEHHAEDSKGYSYEAWGRNITAKSWMFEKAGDDALAIFFLRQKDEYQEVRIIFSDERLIPVFEKQLAQIGFFKQRTRTVEGMEETTYAPDEWEEESDEPTYVITNDGMGLYHLVYMDML